MKKVIFIVFLIFFVSDIAKAQEWLTSLEVGQTLARVQNKMILAVWEDAANASYPVLLKDPKEGFRVIELFSENKHHEVIWEYFVPVLIPEDKYEDLLEEIKGKRNNDYILKFNDDSIKIMDANGNILNINNSQNNFAYSNLSHILENYALDTSFLKQELDSYNYNQNFTTSYRLAVKFLDYAIFAKEILRHELATLSDIYLKEALIYLEESDMANKLVFDQKISLLKIKKDVITNEPRKALRKLKKYDDIEINVSNEPLFAFLHYASYRMLDKVEEAMIWQKKVSLADLKRIKYLIGNTK